MKVFVANENPGIVRAEFARSLIELIMTDIQEQRHVSSVSLHHGGAGVAMFRNITIEAMLNETTDEAICFIDSDIEVQKDTIHILAEALDPAERPVVSGLYFLQLDEGLRPSIFNRHPHTNPKTGNETLHMVAETSFPEDTLITCDGVGAGCLMIHRSLLEAMYQTYGPPAPWFADEVWDGEMYGEDFAFSMRVDQMGFKPYVHTGAFVTHYKTVGLNKMSWDKILTINAAGVFDDADR